VAYVLARLAVTVALAVAVVRVEKQEFVVLGLGLKMSMRAWATSVGADTARGPSRPACAGWPAGGLCHLPLGALSTHARAEPFPTAPFVAAWFAAVAAAAAAAGDLPGAPTQ